MVNQSTIVAFFLLAGFVIFVTQRGELPAYIGLLVGAGTPAMAQPGTPAAANSANSYVSEGFKALTTAAPYIAEAAF